MALRIFFRFINDYRIVVVTPQRVVVLDAGKSSTKAEGIVIELPRSARLGPGSGAWHVIPAEQEKLRVHRRFFKDLQEAGRVTAAA